MKPKDYNIQLHYDGNYVNWVEVTNTGGHTIKFVPEKCPEPAAKFPVGTLVQVDSCYDSKDWRNQRGVVTKINFNMRVVEFGRVVRDNHTSGTFYPDDLEAI